MKVVLEFFATNAPDTLHWTLNSCFGASRSIWVHLAMFRYYTKLGAKRVELVQLMQKFVPWSCFGFFTTNAPNQPHWTLNSCLCASRSVWVYLAIFRYYTKLGTKRVELVQLIQKFVPWSCFGIFRNECTRSTPLDPKLLFRWVLYHLGAFGNVWLPYKTRCKTGRTGAKVRATK